MNDGRFADAMTHHEAGRFADAAALYRAILERAPDHAASLHLLGLITAEQSDPEAGIALIRRAMALEPGCAAHYNSLGGAYRRLGRPDDAVTAYRTAAGLSPGSAAIHSNLATALLDQGERAAAVAHYRQAAALMPRMADIWYNLANALADTDAADETERCYLTTLELKPDFAPALGNYGRWLMTRGRWAEAERRLSEALILVPAQAAAWNNLGVVSRELDRSEAETCFRHALAIEPKLADGHYNLGCLLSADGRPDEAITCHQSALIADPGFAKARLGVCMAQLPVLYRSEAEIARRRQHYAAALAALVAGDPGSLADAIGSSQPFFLPYQGDDDRTLQETYGRFACQLLAEPPVPLAGRPAAGERIRVGIISAFFRDHTVFKLFLEGWLSHFDRDRFHVIGFHTGSLLDDQTARCDQWCDRFVLGLGSADAWRAAIAKAEPHVLLYPEVGMDPVAGRLAAMRLAPIQCVTWGHPETTGLPTIDYFLSSALMEPDDGDAYYSEQLVRLPNLGLCYRPDPGRERTIPHRDAPVFWSGQALYKYLPRYDAIFPRIAAQLGVCQFVFIAFAKSQSLTAIFRDRLWRAFADAGLDADRYVVILPPMSQHDYIDAAGRADVILDTPGWSGGKSTLDCLVHNPAIVTWPGRFMRGRHTAAILQRIGCEVTIAASLDDYVSIAVRLARDPVWRAEVQQSVADGKHRAFNDVSYIRALERFLAEAVGLIAGDP
jgi:predicted O-linked N-acetylglucosamine transferase (SPINDLY family)